MLPLAVTLDACSRYVVTGGERCSTWLRRGIDTTQAPTPVGGAGDRIIGRVVDTDMGTPVNYARIEIISPTRSRGTTTDSTGVFVLDSIAPGEYLTRVKRIGYVRAERRIVVSADAGDTLTIRLSGEWLDGPCGVEKIPWWKFW